MTDHDFTLSTRDVAQQLHVHLDTIARWADQGFIPCARTGEPGSHRRFRQVDVDAFRAKREPVTEDAS